MKKEVEDLVGDPKNIKIRCKQHWNSILIIMEEFCIQNKNYETLVKFLSEKYYIEEEL